MPRYFEFEVVLQELEPRIWRRLLIRTTATFAHLHRAIQDSFGWQDYHLWEFRLPTHQGRVLAGIPDEEYGPPAPDGRKVKLNTYFKGRTAVEWCEYLYDFGDNWTCDVKLVAVRSLGESFVRRLLDGARSGPPEDCGGASGYERAVQFLETGEDADGDPAGFTEWLGGWHPDAFDLAAAKAAFDR